MKDIQALEKVQKKVTKILPRLKNLPCSERLKICKIPTLHYRRIRGDMIETYKRVSGKYKPDIAPTLYKSSVHVTRGNDTRLEKSRVKYDLRKFSFSNRVMNIWNSLPNWVLSANTTNMGKTSLSEQQYTNCFHASIFDPTFQSENGKLSRNVKPCLRYNLTSIWFYCVSKQHGATTFYHIIFCNVNNGVFTAKKI